MDASELAPIVRAILQVRGSHPTRVGIDGFCAAGKTTLADALAVEIRGAGRGVIRASTDDFQNPPAIRWQLGQRSPMGFFRHQIDVVSLRSLLLDPLSPEGSRRFHTSSYDVHSSSPNLSAEFLAEPTDVLLFDGLFIHAPALSDAFELTIYVSAAFETCLQRALARNQERATSTDELEAVYRERYIPGFELYCQEVAPERRATIVVKT